MHCIISAVGTQVGDAKIFETLRKMTYTYVYKTSDGARHEDAMDAPSREAVFEALRARGIRPIKVVAADGSKANGEKEEGRRRGVAT